MRIVDYTRRYVLLAILLLFPACLKHKQPLRPAAASSFNANNYADLPIPIGAEIKHLVSEDNGLLLHITHALTAHQISEWISPEMDRLCWHELSTLSSEEYAVFIYEKPRTFCTLYIDFQKHQLLIAKTERTCSE